MIGKVKKVSDSVETLQKIIISDLYFEMIILLLWYIEGFREKSNIMKGSL